MTLEDIDFPLLDASLNFAATVLIIVGYTLIRRRHEQAHKIVMLTAFAVSIAFLISYLAYHVWPIGKQTTHYVGNVWLKAIYLSILATHIVLAMTVPVLTSVTIYLGLRDQRTKHLRWARWTLPIWLYVSITGVVIYLMLYRLPHGT